jgi:polar amino acid transport system substrate-binding protein
MLDAWADVAPILATRYEETGDFPLGTMMYSEVAREIPTILTDTLSGSERIARIVEDLTGFARQKPQELTEDVDLDDVCRSAVKLILREINAHTNRFDESYASSPHRVRGDFQRLEQVVINLILNACQALPDRERALSVETGRNADAHVVTLRVSDEGTGISPEAMAHITDPFFTTKRDRGGTGLGLSICSTIVREHRGTLRFLPREGGGTLAELTLPNSPSGSVN